MSAPIRQDHSQTVLVVETILAALPQLRAAATQLDLNSHKRASADIRHATTRLSDALEALAAKPKWTDWLAAKLGTRQWVVAGRLTDRLQAKGYEIALSQKRFTQLREEYEASP